MPPKPETETPEIKRQTTFDQFDLAPARTDGCTCDEHPTWCKRHGDTRTLYPRSAASHSDI